MLYGKNVRLRPLESSDLKALAEWRNANRDAFFSPWLIAVSEQAAWYQRYASSARERMFIIESEIDMPLPKEVGGGKQKTWRPIGTIALCDINLHHRRAELGRVLIANAKDRKKGFAEDAVLTLLDFAFSSLGLNRVYVEVFESDSNAIGLYTKCGFKKEGTLKQAVWKDVCFRDVSVMARLKGE